VFNHYPKGKAVYIALLKALVRESEGLEDAVPGKAWKEVSMCHSQPVAYCC